MRIAEDGEVLVRGYSVMQGYLDDPAATAEAIDADGWLHTGDLGNLDDAGRLRIIGRKKDMFIVGGFNAYPAEIEGFLLEHPAVAQVAVIGVPDERLGQVGKAFVVASARSPKKSYSRGAENAWPASKAPRRWSSRRAAAQRDRQGDERPTSLTDSDIHSMVIASDYRVPDPTRVWPLLNATKRRSPISAPTTFWSTHRPTTTAASW